MTIVRKKQLIKSEAFSPCVFIGLLYSSQSHNSDSGSLCLQETHQDSESPVTPTETGKTPDNAVHLSNSSFCLNIYVSRVIEFLVCG